MGRMEVVVYPDAESFLAVAQDWLEAHEVEHCLLLGVARRMRGAPPESDLLFATVTDAGRLAVAAVMTPPYPLLLVATDHAALPPLVDGLLAAGWSIPGVTGPEAAAEAFGAAWAKATGQTARLVRDMRLYCLEDVIPPPAPPGRFRQAVEADAPLLADWMAAFEAEATPDNPPSDTATRIRVRIAAGELFVWEDGGQPVTFAGTTRPLRTCISIGPVYTPPEQRRRGYATACVATLSQWLLDQGWQHCALFTDLANPTSNSIYQKIGYHPVCDYRTYRFS
ncbi:MAG: GNAT family N-acetyltransferase [Anaerolineae bacterium]|nr:GNAT family N-acetyltransferase [Anaerolineae bacterium]